MRFLAAAGLMALACAFGCTSREQKPDSPRADRAPQREWTRAFAQEAVLVADEIAIEGPADLLDHVALRQDPEENVYSTKTTAQGLFQELAARPEIGVEVRAQLDAWSLAALKRITVLQRPGEVPVTVRARGNAFWAAADGSGERRENELVFRGARGR